MAAIDWPWNLVTIQFEDYGLGTDSDVRRTDFEDGAVGQVQKQSRALDVRRVNLIVKLSDVAAFRSYLRMHGNKWFNFRDFEDGADRECRIRGGRGAVELRGASGRRFEGERYMRASAELEGWW